MCVSVCLCVSVCVHAHSRGMWEACVHVCMHVCVCVHVCLCVHSANVYTQVSSVCWGELEFGGRL